MDINIDNVSNLTKKVLITFSADEINKEYDSILKDIQKKSSIKGFRPGKAPKNLLVKKFDKSILAEIVENLLPKALQKAYKDHDIRPATEPMIEKLDPVERDKDYSVEAVVEIIPDVNISSDLIEMEEPKIEITEDMLNETMEHFLRNELGLTNVEDEVQEGDQIIGTRPLTEEEIEQQKSSAENSDEPAKDTAPYALLAKESDSFTSENLKEILGKKIGEKFTHTEPDNSSDEDKKSEKSFEVTISEIKRFIKPELDEETLKKMNFQTLDDLNKFVRDMTWTNEYMRLSTDAVTEFRDKVYPKFNFDIPPSVHEKHIKTVSERLFNEKQDEEAKKNNSKSESSDVEEQSPEKEPFDFEKFKESEKELYKEAFEKAASELRIMYFVDINFEDRKLKVNQSEAQFRLMSYIQSLGIPMQWIEKMPWLDQVKENIIQTQKEIEVIKYVLGQKFGDNFNNNFSISEKK